MNIDDKSQFRQCTSCQMCGAVCPTLAISIRLNREGFYRPEVDYDKCIDCGLCVKSCYKFDKDVRSSLPENVRLYSSYSKDKEILSKTTSGGIGDYLAKRLSEQGYTCIGVGYDYSDNVAKGVVAHSAAECDAFRSSKYIQSLSVEAFLELVKTQKKQKYAVFGLPCQIYAVDRFLRRVHNRDAHILIDLYCHGCPSLNLWKKYLKDIVRPLPTESIEYVNFRSKAKGWGEYVIKVNLTGDKSNRTFISKKVQDPFFTMFFSDMVLNDSCSQCEIRGSLDYTDIRMGDFWGNIFLGNHSGVSAVTICSERGESAFKLIENDVDFEPQSLQTFLPYQSWGKKYNVNSVLRRKLLDMLADDNVSLQQVVKTYHNSLSRKGRLKMRLKNIVKSMPSGWMVFIKKSYYKINKS